MFRINTDPTCTLVLGYGHKGRKKKSAKSCGVVGGESLHPSVEQFCAWWTLEIRIEGVGIFEYHYAVQALYFNKTPQRTMKEALIPSPLLSP